MNKFFFAFIFALLCFLPTIWAVQTVSISTITSLPDNPLTINWTYSDSTNSQNQKADLFYSTLPWNGTNAIALHPINTTQVDLLSACDFPLNTVWQTSDITTTGLPTTARTGLIQNIYFVNLNGTWVINLLYNDSIPSKTRLTFYYDDATSAWKEDTAEDYNSGLINHILPVGFGNLENWITMGTEHYIVINNNGTFLGYQWDGSAWIPNNDINRGLDSTITEFKVFEFQNIYRLLHTLGYDSILEMDWNGAGWMFANDVNKGLGKITTRSQLQNGYLVKNGNLFLISGNEYQTVPSAVAFNGSSGWVENNDFNRGLPKLTSPVSSFAFTTVDSNGAYSYVFFAQGAGVTNYYDIFRVNLNSSIYYTQEAEQCSYSWDISSVPSGDYYVDINANNGTTTQYGNSNQFSIYSQNYYAGLIVNDISNVSHTIDKNTINLYPTDSTQDFEFSVDSNGFVGNVFFKIFNSDKSLKQYFAWTCDSLTCVSTDYSLNDTITFGSNPYTAIQKIWNNSTGFNYSWADSFTGSDVRSYLFKYQATFKSWYSLANTDWQNSLIPASIDYNGISRDLFSVSAYSNIHSSLIEQLPIITSNFGNSNYVFQFNAYSDSTTTNVLKADTLENRDLTPLRVFSTYSTEKRISVNDLNDNYFVLASSAASANNMYLGIYNLIERGYFTKALTVLDSDNATLPIMIGDANDFYSYITEGQEFRISTEINDPDSKLDYYEISVYVGAVDPANRLKYWKKTFASTGGRIELNDLLDGVVDLTANAPARSVRVAVRVVDENANYAEVQSKIIKLRQYPATPGDLRFTFTQYNKKVGDTPKGRVSLYSNAPNNIIGVEFHLEALNQDDNSADYNITYYKDRDFSCLSIDCSFDYAFTDYIFPRQDNYIIKAWVLVGTENKSTTNNLLYKQIVFPVYFKEFQTLRLVQAFERQDFNYTNSEIIPLILQIKDSDLSNLKNAVDVKIRLWACGMTYTAPGDDDCVPIDINYSPDGFLYDNTSGDNLWYFRQIFLQSNLSALNDGNYYRVEGVVEDKEKKHQFTVHPLLVGKCATYGTNMVGNILLDMAKYIGITGLPGCNALAPNLITLDVNSAFEKRIGIQNSRTTTIPNQECFSCLNVDVNNLYYNSLQQNLFCALTYSMGEKQIDKFKLTIANQFSDLAETKYSQFVSLDVPYELIYANDPALMIAGMQKDSAINTVGDLILAFDNWLLLTGQKATNAKPVFKDGTGQYFGVAGALYQPTGYDCNLNETIFSPNHILGTIFFKIKGLEIINKKDYETSNNLVSKVPANIFRRYAETNRISLPQNKTNINIFVNALTPVGENSLPSYFIINEEIINNPIKKENISTDSNSNLPKYETAPTVLKFNFISDMFFNDERSVSRRIVPLTLTAILTKNCGILGINCAGSGIANIFLKGNPSWLIQNWFFLFMLGVVILFGAIVYRSVKSGNTINVFNQIGKKRE